jgi:hypothetical protein
MSGANPGTKKAISRRDFLKIGGVGIAGLEFAGCGGGEQAGARTGCGHWVVLAAYRSGRAFRQ